MRDLRRHEAASCATSTRRARSGFALAAAIVASLAVLIVTPVAPAAAVAPPSNPFPLVARVSFTNCVPTCAEGTRVNPPGLFYIDAGRRQLIAPSDNAAHLLDLDTLQQTASVPIGAPTGSGPPIYDLTRQRLVYGGGVGDVACPTVPVISPPACPGDIPKIRGVSVTEYTVNATTGERQPVVAEFVMPARFGGHKVTGLAHDLERDLLFVLTQGDPSAGVANVNEVWLHAVSASLTGVGNVSPLKWSYQVQGCMNTELNDAGSRRAFLGVGSTGDSAYMMCQDVVPDAPGMPTIHGVAVVDFHGVDPRLPGVQVNFTRDFFPLGANFSQGFTFGDPAGDRMAAAVAGAGGQRLYMFNARHRAWTGSVLLGPNNTNVKAGVFDVATGRAYSISSTRGAIATDAAPVPMLQGIEHNLGVAPGGNHTAAFDPVTRRLFTRAFGDSFIDEQGRLLGGTEYNHVRVYEDRTPPYLDPLPIDPDAETNDIAEDLATQVTHTGGASAFGARAMLVGGTRATAAGGALQNGTVWNPNEPSTGLGADNTDLQIDGGDRGLFLGRVSESQLTGSSESGEAKAVAVGASLDETTESDIDSKIDAPFARTGGAPPDGAQWEQLKTNVGELNEASCFDFGAEDDPRVGQQPGSKASCLQRDSVAASASSSEQMSALPVQVGFAASDVKLVLNEDDGIISRATAVARGIHAEMVGVGAIDIGEVRSVAETVAHGRPGTAESELTTTISYARILGPDGDGFSCTQCDPNAVANAINTRFPMRVRAIAPRPATDEAITGSPGGAQAVVMKEHYSFWNDAIIHGDGRKEVPGLQLVFYNDGADASRVVVQLGAVFAESKYIIGDPAEEIVVEPASLALELLDEAGEPLAGGVFEVREDASGGFVDDCLAEDAADDAAEEADAGTDLETKSNHSSSTTTTTSEADDEPADEIDETEDTVDECVADEEAEDADEGTDLETKSNHASSTTTTTTAADDDSTTSTTVAEDEYEDEANEVEETVDELTDELIENGACVTAEDGMGDCVFEDLVPGSYIVTQKAAPAGYAPAEDFAVTLAPGFASTVSFTNVKAVAAIEISLTDDADPPAPLPGGEFVVMSDDGDGILGDADVELGKCVTGADGACEPFADVPLGAYVVHQSVAPNGLMPADDVAFALDLPGQAAVLTFVNGAPPVDPPPPADTGGEAAFVAAPAVATPSYSRTSFIPPPPPPVPVVVSQPIAPERPSGIGRIVQLPAETASFLAREPGEALLFAAVWSLLLAPAYLVARRRKLNLVKEGI